MTLAACCRPSTGRYCLALDFTVNLRCPLPPRPLAPTRASALTPTPTPNLIPTPNLAPTLTFAWSVTLAWQALLVTERIDAVKEYLQWRGVPKELGIRVRRYYEHFYTQRAIFDEASILGEFNPSHLSAGPIPLLLPHKP